MATSTVTRQEKEQKTKIRHPFNDLCVTCIHANSCQAARNRKSPVFFCEEFEVETLSGIHFNNGPASPAPMPPVEPGICFNCAKRFSCNIKKPEGGIRHCEMYE